MQVYAWFTHSLRQLQPQHPRPVVQVPARLYYYLPPRRRRRQQQRAHRATLLDAYLADWARADATDEADVRAALAADQEDEAEAQAESGVSSGRFFC